MSRKQLKTAAYLSSDGTTQTIIWSPRVGFFCLFVFLPCCAPSLGDSRWLPGLSVCLSEASGGDIIGPKMQGICQKFCFSSGSFSPHPNPFPAPTGVAWSLQTV